MGSLCLGCVITSLIEKFGTPKWRPFRAAVFLFAGISTIGVFLAIGLKPSPYKLNIKMDWFSIAGSSFIIGACLYAARVPERCKPGAFDICGASH